MERNELFERFLEICPSDRITPEVKDYLVKNGFFTAPASTKFHGSYEGGLFDHSLNVAKQLVLLTVSQELKWSRPDSPVVIGLFHDLCKIDQYRKVGNSYTWVNTEVAGHGTKSLIYLSKLMTLTPEESACIRHHMGAFGSKDDQVQYTEAIHKYPNVLWTHTADMIASQIIEQE